jgi:cell division protein FtsB
MMNYFQKRLTLPFDDKFRQCEEEIAVLKADNDQLEREKSDYKERLKQLTKTKLVDDLIQKKTGVAQRLSGGLSKKIDDNFFHSLCSFRCDNRFWYSFTPTSIIILTNQ